ncbi:High affinity Ca2+/Mn2+ P-type ATPase-like protein, partial [Ceratobasidium sp. UAMH 11750]
MLDICKNGVPKSPSLPGINPPLSNYPVCIINAIFRFLSHSYRSDGRELHRLANELVPGDVVAFQVGDRIPVDLRLITSLDLELGELCLTDETRPARKDTESCPSGAPLGEKLCIAFMDTLVRNGTGIVISTSLCTEFGAVFAVSQVFVVDHITDVDPSGSSPSSISHVTPAVRKTLEIGEICNNAFRNTEGVNAGQSTDVAMPNVLAEFGVKDELR